MTLSNPLVKVSYIGDGKNRRFDVPFVCLERADIKLIITAPDGAQLTPAAGEFMVSAAGDYVVYPVEASGKEALGAGYKITLYRQTPATQLNDLVQQNVLQKETLERSLDKLTMLAQEVRERLTRTVSVGIGEEQGDVSVDELVTQMRELYAQIKDMAQKAGEEAQKAIEAAVDAYEQAEKLYAHREDYTAGTPVEQYDGSLTDFDLAKKYLADGDTLKVFVNGALKIPGADYTEVIDPELSEKGNAYGKKVTFAGALASGDKVTFMWGDTLTMPGGEIAQAAADAAEKALSHAKEAEASAELAKQRAEGFLTKHVGELYYSQSKLADDNLGALPGWTGQTVANARDNYPGLWEFVKKHPELCLTSAAHAEMLRDYKHVPFYVQDVESGTLTLPVYRRFISGVHEDGARGGFMDRMRPITGELTGGKILIKNPIASGAFSVEIVSDSHTGTDKDNTPVASKIKLNSGNLREHFNGEETAPAHAREYPWIVAYNTVPRITAANGGVVSIWKGTKEEYETRLDIPATQLCLIEEESPEE